jgi:hypothetical protein
MSLTKAEVAAKKRRVRHMTDADRELRDEHARELAEMVIADVPAEMRAIVTARMGIDRIAYALGIRHAGVGCAYVLDQMIDECVSRARELRKGDDT